MTLPRNFHGERVIIGSPRLLVQMAAAIIRSLIVAIETVSEGVRVRRVEQDPWRCHRSSVALMSLMRIMRSRSLVGEVSKPYLR